MSLVKQLESNIFCENFHNRSILNIILDYSEDYKPLYDQVVKNLTEDIVLKKSVKIYGKRVCTYMLSMVNSKTDRYSMMEECVQEKNKKLFVQQMLIWNHIKNRTKELYKLSESERVIIIKNIVNKYDVNVYKKLI